MVKGTVYAKVELHGASPNTSYTLYLYYFTDPGCTSTTSTKLTTDSSGGATKTISSSSFGFHDWFVDVVGATDNENPLVHLP
jgi:hypothetical protein